MKAAGIRSITVKKFRPTPSKEKVVERENILKRDFSTTTSNEKWVGDITYIYTLKDGWCYLASVMDLHSKKIIGYSFGRSMTTELVTKALENACIESFHAILKKEEVNHVQYLDFNSANMALFQFIEG